MLLRKILFFDLKSYDHLHRYLRHDGLHHEVPLCEGEAHKYHHFASLLHFMS